MTTKTELHLATRPRGWSQGHAAAEHPPSGGGCFPRGARVDLAAGSALLLRGCYEVRHANYENLSDYEFEGLVGDVLAAELGVRFERFARGPDQGIDLRHFRDRQSADVVQVKHYMGSTWNDLKQAAKRELTRLKKLKPKPASYRL